MKNLTDRLSSLSPKQRALLEQKMKEKNLDTTKIPKKEARIPRRGHKNPSPLSIDQERLWFYEYMNPGQPTYNVYGALRMEGNLNVEALEYAVNEIIKRHEAWRTTFDVVNEQPVQIVHDELPIKLDHIDLTHVPDGELEAAANQAKVDAIRIPFDLVKGPIMRVALIKQREHLHNMVLTIHHIITDRITFSIFFYEMMQHYRAFLKNTSANLPEPHIQYSDFTEWQREYLTGEVKDKLVGYWKKQLADSDFVLNLMTDYPRPPQQSHKGARSFMKVRKEVIDRLKEIGKSVGASSFMTLMAAYKAFLYRYTGQEDMIVGTPFANRNRQEMEMTLGYFLTGIVMRTQVGGDITFLELLEREKDVAYGAYSHQELPIGMLIDEVQPKRDQSRNPLYQACFVYVDVPEEPVSLPELDLAFEWVDGETAKYDITLALTDEEDGQQGFFEYSPAMFTRETAEQWCRHWLNMLDSIVADPTQKLVDLPLMSEAEQQQILVEWNDTDVELPEHFLVQEIFEAQVERTPDAVAVVYEDTHLTYRELNERANQLAYYLKKVGVGPDKLVGLLMDRSLELEVALLGTLKAGGAYIPLDPSFPQERLAYIAEEAQATVILTQQHLLDRLPETQAHVLSIDGEWEQVAQESTANPPVVVNGDNLAYVLYTSGSTGRPKGAMIPHLALSNQALHYINTYNITENDRMLQKSPFSFDASVWEFFAIPMAGAQLVMAVPGGHQDMGYLVEATQKYEITLIQFVPTLLQLFMEERSVDNCTSLRAIVAGGEVLTLDLQDKVFELLPNCELVNIYGPTECTINATAFTCRRDERPRNTLPIGRPVSNAKLYVLDAYKRPVPVGVPGELYIGGYGVAKGYLNRPQLTEERFLPNPFSQKPNDRLYRTGDLVRYLPDGNLEYVGRIDNQVKINGVRIELGEIEAVLSQHPTVKDVAVLCREDVPGDKRLVGYVITTYAVTGAELRAAMKEQLPDYMVPSSFVMLEEMPLTASGKIDRRSLPVPTDSLTMLDVEYVAPRDVTEEVLQLLWQELLGIPKVGIETNFFEIGGNSLNAMQMISKVRETFQVQVPVQKLFTISTIEGLSAVLKEYETKPGQVEAVAKVRKKLLAMTPEERQALLEAKKGVRG